ncbi:phosphotyrosine protein phosphatase [Proteus columbae]|uniref:low molecular weight protein tyrosine phosphatase family protein n=1 Tax=Proteus columbae TaxID=1987580 RepID=UPI002888FC8E|nr:phosphotyrosine protein phosphatase [Proteus columbae]
MNILFICSKNQWRSPTAELLFADREGINTHSAGTRKDAQCVVDNELLKWADLVLVMESKHLNRLSVHFPAAMRYKKAHVLGIPDNYRFNDPALIELLEQKVRPYLPMEAQLPTK